MLILSAKMLIPATFDSRPVLFDQPRDLVQFIATEIAGPRKFEWPHPITSHIPDPSQHECALARHDRG